MVSRSRWLDPRHMVHVTDRFTRDKTDSLQHAFFNGEGYAVLENLWGFWYQMDSRDAEAMLRFTRIERAFAENLSSAEWRPHTPAAIQPGVFASEFPLPSHTLWTVVNRNEFDITGEQLRIPHKSGVRYFDLWHGVELQPIVSGDQATLSFPMDGLGFGAVLATTEPPSANLTELLAFMSERSKQSLRSYSKSFVATPQTVVEIAHTKPAATAPEGMLAIPEADFDFSVRGIEIEGGNDPGVDVQYPWEDISAPFA